MKESLKIVLLIAAIFIIGTSIYAQNKGDLQAQYKALQSQIGLTKQLISEARSKKTYSINELNMINAQIKSREQLIGNMNNQLSILKKDISNNSAEIKSLENQIEELKQDYAKMIRYAQKNNQNQNQLTFILSSETFNQAFKRVSYLKQYATFRKKQATEIQSSIEHLNEKTISLEAQKNEQSKLLNSEQEAKGQLVSEQDAKDKIVSNLAAEEKKLSQDLGAKEASAKKLNDAIEEIIRKEIAEAKKRAEEEARRKAELAKGESKPGEPSPKPKVTEKVFEDTPALKALAASFIANKGKLPWPVEKGIVTGYFGEQPHPVLKGIKIKNNGIDISTNREATVRAVFDGQVIQVVFNPGFNKAVIVKHGDYFSVYSNLKETYVKNGDNVKTQQALGLVITDPESAKTEVHLEIWKGMTKSNPTSWLSPKSAL